MHLLSPGHPKASTGASRPHTDLHNEPQLINPTVRWPLSFTVSRLLTVLQNLDLMGKTGFFWFAFAAATTIWAFFRLPETRHRTFEELDLLFIDKVPARKFAKTTVDAYEEDHTQA